MPEIPDCLERRYRALDELIDELTARKSEGSEVNCSKRCDNAGIKLMCDFWNILKDNPDCNLKREVQERMGLSSTSIRSSFGPHKVTCYMADRMGKDSDCGGNDAINRLKKACCKGSEPSNKSECCSSRASPKQGSDVMPLSKVLCNLKDAASFDKKCNERVNDLMTAQKRLQEQIQHLEHREKEGIQLLKQADCMWSCMEDTYKKKVADSLERQNAILKELKLAEVEVSEWRKNKKDLEFQLNNVNKCQQEIVERIHQKKNDIKTMKDEIQDFNKRIENGAKDIEAAKKSLSSKKQASDRIVQNIQKEISETQKLLIQEKKRKSEKEQEGAAYMKEAREELQKICKVLLQKKLENEDLKAEREALGEEIEMLRQTCDICQDKCKNKQESINKEILKVEKEIAEFRVKCIKCHECVDTADARKYCSDCPRCQQERDCILEDDHCVADPTNECVCMNVKRKFMDNVFENMYTVLERQVKTRHGKCLAETIMQCLKRSRNGKIDPETRKILQEFILSTVKKNLNLTIIGGAVKTRCEMDPETYKQLMLCLKQVKVSKAPKVDKGTVAKKDPCRRWGGESECNCPGGPKTCICTKKAPPAPHDPTSCPQDPEDMADNEKTKRMECPHRQAPCSVECGRHGLDSLVGTEVAPWVPEPCKEKSCSFSKNMRAAQCILGPERLSDLSQVPSRIQRSMSFDAEDPKGNIINKKLEDTKERKEVSIEHKVDSHVPKNKAKNNSEDKKGKHGNKDLDSNKASHKSKKSDNEKNILTRNILNKEVPEMKSCSRETTKPLATWKISILNDEGDVEDCSTELINTPSGELGIELDDKFFNLVDKKINENPKSTSGVLVKDKTGYYTLDFNPTKISKGGLKIKVKKTPSGSMSIVVDKTFIENIKLGTNSHQKSDKSIEIEVTKKVESLVAFDKHESHDNIKRDKNIDEKLQDIKKDNINESHENIRKYNNFDQDSNKYNQEDEKRQSVTEENKNENIKKDYKLKEKCHGIKQDAKLEDSNKYNKVDEKRQDVMEENKNENIKKGHKLNEKSHDLRQDAKRDYQHIDITKNSNGDDNFKKNLQYYYAVGIRNVILKIESNNHFKYVKAKVLRVPSGNIALEVENNTIIENNVTRDKTDGLLHLSDSDTFLLDFKQANMNKLRNTIIRKGLNTTLLIVKEQFPVSNTSYKDICKEYFNVKIKGANNDVIDPPVILKPTPSDNFLVIVDKEFERGYNKLIENIPIDETVGSGVLTKTRSGQYVIKLQDSKENGKGFNAYLVKSTSGNIKVVVSGPAFDEIRRSFSERESNGSLTSSKLFEMFKSPERKSRCTNNEKFKHQQIKSNSDSSIFDISRTKNQQSFITESNSLKKTESGRYSVVLDKESKKAFVNNLGNYLKKNSNSLIPIKRTNSGGIIVVFNGDENLNGQYGSLKISSSGNVYVIVDDKNLNDRKIKKSESSNHIIRTVRNPSNKAVATTCEAKPDPCCNYTKCVCEEVQNTRSDWFFSDSERDGTSYKEIVTNKSGNVIFCDPNKYSTKADFDTKRSESCNNKSSPYIVIKPCDKCRQQRVAASHKTTTRRSEQCFYVIDSVCPYHKNRYDTVSNELLEISGLCNNGYINTEIELKESLEGIPSQTVTDQKPLASTAVNSFVEQEYDYLDTMPPQLPSFLGNFSIY